MKKALLKKYIELRDRMTILVIERGDTKNLMSAQDELARQWRILFQEAQELESALYEDVV